MIFLDFSSTFNKILEGILDASRLLCRSFMTRFWSHYSFGLSTKAELSKTPESFKLEDKTFRKITLPVYNFPEEMNFIFRLSFLREVLFNPEVVVRVSFSLYFVGSRKDTL